VNELSECRTKEACDYITLQKNIAQKQSWHRFSEGMPKYQFNHDYKT